MATYSSRMEGGKKNLILITNGPLGKSVSSVHRGGCNPAEGGEPRLLWGGEGHPRAPGEWETLRGKQIWEIQRPFLSRSVYHFYHSRWCQKLENSFPVRWGKGVDDGAGGEKEFFATYNQGGILAYTERIV